ncbi:hypothetical protein PIB30_067676 [Stylosanthes scabra]|uniref:Uncharacterized protein n=1 Tax=Stylosanthes scabra TaxID=79078 RepID=A0ABU6RNK0_9FABA|nr:hypothetical protein [Stylosanthes scabra]
MRARVKLRVASRIDSELIQKKLWHYSPVPSAAITSTPELPLMHRLQLHEALFILYVFIPYLRYGYHVFLSISPLQFYESFEFWMFVISRFLSFQGRSSLGKDQESSPMRGYGNGRWSNSKLEDALGVMAVKGCTWMLKWSGGTAYV